MYRDVGTPMHLMSDAALAKFDAPAKSDRDAAPTFTAQEVENLIHSARVEAVAETEDRMRNQASSASEEEAAKIKNAIDLFQTERKEYFARVESDVVHLAIAIAAKILHRESQVDPMLIAGLVRVAIDKLHDGSAVSVRVSSSEVEKWKKYLINPANGATIQIVADDNLGAKDCVLETDLGSANFSIDAQLKEVEQGFFDLLAQRPSIK
jgi:flagellar assembly protein FliH